MIANLRQNSINASKFALYTENFTQMTKNFTQSSFPLNINSEVTHHQNKGSVEKNVSLKGNFNCYKIAIVPLVSTSLKGRKTNLLLHDSYIATIFFATFLLPKVPSH